MLGHNTPRDMLIARLAIARRREAVLKQLDAIDAEAKPYDEVIDRMLEDGVDIHLEFLDPFDKRFRKFAVRRDDWGGVEFVPATSVRELRFPVEPPSGTPPVADAATAIDPGDAPRVAEFGYLHAEPSDGPEVKAAVDARVGPFREAVVRDGLAASPADVDPVAGLGSLLREARYGEDRPVRAEAASALASIREAMASDDPITLAALDAALEDEGFPALVGCDDETVVPDDDGHAVVEHQAAS